MIKVTSEYQKQESTMSYAEKIANLKAWLLDQGATYGAGVDRTGQRRHGWWLDGVFLGRDARDAVATVRG